MIVKGESIMCGIYAAINTSSVTDSLLSGLSSLTYRGYDSAGIAVINGGKIERRRASGKLDKLSNLLKISPLNGHIGIAHTRWATHGLPIESNAHPHMTSRVAVAHNGIVENYTELRSMLESNGYIFESETDSETIAQLITYYLDTGLTPEKSLCKALSNIEGSFGVVVIFSNSVEELFAACKGSPLVLGQADNGFYVSSDINAFASTVSSITYLKNGDVARLTKISFEIFNLEGQKLERLLENLERESYVHGIQHYQHFMQKEIYEQPDVFERTWRHYFNNATRTFQLPILPFNVNELERISLVACGTSYFSSMVGKYWLESIAGISVDIDVASEYRYRDIPIVKNSAVFFISQSGETADTLAALYNSKSAQQPCVSLVNVLSSTMARESNAILPTLAGPEIGVASTKAFISQITTLLILALALRNEKHYPSTQAFHSDEKMIEQMVRFPEKMSMFLADIQPIKTIAKSLKHYQHILYLGRGIAYPLAEEGALKLKEISYIHAEAYPAGELKHGPLALVDENMPVIVIAPPGPLFSKTLSNLREVSSRGGRVTLISNQEGIMQAGEYIEHSITMPDVDPLLMPLMYTLPLQLLAYYVAIQKGSDIDQPRNLAKSVTVE